MMLQEPSRSLGPDCARETVQSALKSATGILRQAGIESARLDAEVLLAAVVGAGKEDLYSRSERALTVEETNRYCDLVGRRSRSEPVAYIVGSREFWSLDFCVAPGVFIPRPETELLVELTGKFLHAQGKRENSVVRVLDLCAGSGAIAVSLAQERSDLEIWGTELSPKAVRMAGSNAARHGVETRCRFLQGDLFEPVRDRTDFFDVIVSNPPYIRGAELHTLPVDVRDWEPMLALDGGADGMEFYRRIFEQAPVHLTEEGFVLVEIGSDLEAQVCGLISLSGVYREGVVHADYTGRARAVSARKLPS
ncbi:MAG: peptide chain release factor N(5)-glutamine methyltransferase [Candidatus Binatia bacterium]